jgi:hypothetical protein
MQILNSHSGLKDYPMKKGECNRKMLHDVRLVLIKLPTDTDLDYRISTIGIMCTVALRS